MIHNFQIKQKIRDSMRKISRKLKLITNPKKNEKLFKKQNISWGIDICMLKK